MIDRRSNAKARHAAREQIRGLYAVTPDCVDTPALLAMTGTALRAGVRLLQYRNKTACASLRREQIVELTRLCAQFDTLLVVNDDWEMALSLGARALHIGRDDGDVRTVRAAAGENVLIGVSCYASLDLARNAAPFADYLAFGSLFASPTKPVAPGAPLSLLGAARQFGLPIVGIGGIGAANAQSAIEAGADAVAVISGVFNSGAIDEAVEKLLRLFTRA